MHINLNTFVLEYDLKVTSKAKHISVFKTFHLLLYIVSPRLSAQTAQISAPLPFLLKNKFVVATISGWSVANQKFANTHSSTYFLTCHPHVRLFVGIQYS